MMPIRPYTAFFIAPAASFTTKDIFDALLLDGVPASVVQSLQRSPNGNVLITFASRQYHDLFLPRFSLLQCVAELPDSAIKHRFNHYSRIFSSRRGRVLGYPDSMYVWS